MADEQKAELASALRRIEALEAHKREHQLLDQMRAALQGQELRAKIREQALRAALEKQALQAAIENERRARETDKQLLAEKFERTRLESQMKEQAMLVQMRALESEIQQLKSQPPARYIVDPATDVHRMAPLLQRAAQPQLSPPLAQAQQPEQIEQSDVSTTSAHQPARAEAAVQPQISKVPEELSAPSSAPFSASAAFDAVAPPPQAQKNPAQHRQPPPGPERRHHSTKNAAEVPVPEPHATHFFIRFVGQ